MVYAALNSFHVWFCTHVGSIGVNVLWLVHCPCDPGPCGSWGSGFKFQAVYFIAVFDVFDVGFVIAESFAFVCIN